MSPVDFGSASGSGTSIPDGDVLTGHLVGSRKDLTSSVGGGTGRVRLHFFTAYKTITVSSVEVSTGGTASAATPTLQRIGLFSVSSIDTITLVARSADDTAMFSSTNTVYEKAFDTADGFPATYTLVKGQRYAIGVLIVSGTTVALLAGTGNNVGSLALSTAVPRTSGYINGQTDIPTAPVLTGSLTASTDHFYAKLTT